VGTATSRQGKAAKIAELGVPVAMVRDSINDSSAVIAMAIGIAFSLSLSVVVEAADIVLMHWDLFDVVAAVHLARAIFGIIRRTACAHNTLGVSLAVGVFLSLRLYLHLTMANAEMGSSSVGVAKTRSTSSDSCA
jgi:Cu+-exporting ATPase